MEIKKKAPASKKKATKKKTAKKKVTKKKTTKKATTKKKVAKKKVAKKKVAKKKVAKKKVAKKKTAKKRTVKKAPKDPDSITAEEAKEAVDKVTKKKKAKKKVAKKKTPRKRKYLNNRDLLAAVVDSKEKGQMSDTLAKMLQMLTARYGKKGNFANYTYNEDMQAYAMMMLVRTWAGFKPERSNNPFAYYTQSIKNSFIQFLNQEKKQRNIRDASLVNIGLTPSHTFMNEYAEKEAAEKEEKENQAKEDNTPSDFDGTLEF